jgi:hypothetical protein
MITCPEEPLAWKGERERERESRHHTAEFLLTTIYYIRSSLKYRANKSP